MLVYQEDAVNQFTFVRACNPESSNYAFTDCYTEQSTSNTILYLVLENTGRESVKFKYEKAGPCECSQPPARVQYTLAAPDFIII